VRKLPGQWINSEHTVRMFW